MHNHSSTGSGEIEDMIIGIDPGLSGAVVSFSQQFNKLIVRDMPTVKGKTRGRDLDTEELLDLAYCHVEVDLIVMEKPVLSRPGEGRGSIGKFGYTTGLTEGIYRGAYPDIQFCLVSPQKWKAHFGLIRYSKLAVT